MGGAVSCLRLHMGPPHVRASAVGGMCICVGCPRSVRAPACLCLMCPVGLQRLPMTGRTYVCPVPCPCTTLQQWSSALVPDVQSPGEAPRQTRKLPLSQPNQPKNHPDIHHKTHSTPLLSDTAWAEEGGLGFPGSWGAAWSTANIAHGQRSPCSSWLGTKYDASGASCVLESYWDHP